MESKKVSMDEYKKLKDWYLIEIKRRDKRIEELEFQNKMFLKSSLKQSNENIKLNDYTKKINQNKLEDDING